MQPEKNSNLLSSWKEIAAYLKCDVRTCLRYEKKYNLPVIRIDKIKRSRVYAYKNDLDNWLVNLNKNQTTLEKSSLQKKTRKFLFYSFFFILIVVSVFIILPYLKGNQNPTKFFIENNILNVMDINNNVLWNYQFENKINTHSAETSIFGDITKDKENVLLFLYDFEDKASTSSKLFCFSSKGKILWEFTPGREVSTQNEEFSNTFLISTIRIIDFEDNRNSLIFVGAAHSPWYPFQISILDSKGTSVGEYWNSGHINKDCIKFEDLDEDGQKEILIGGQNNGYACAFLAVLDPMRLSGSSPQAETPDYKFIGMEQGLERLYILFPKTILNDLFQLRNRTKHLKIEKEEKKIVVTIHEHQEGLKEFMIKYVFDFHLNVLEIKPEDDYLQKIKELIANNLISEFSVNSILEYKNQIKYWDGIKWTKTTSMNSYSNK